MMMPFESSSRNANQVMICYATILIFAHLFVLSQAKKEICTALEWTEYKRSFGKVYTDKSEDAIRREIFCSNLIHINKHNARSKDTGFELGLNHMSDWNETEIGAMLGYDQKPEIEEMMQDSMQLPAKSLSSLINMELLGNGSHEIPDNLDWRDHPNRVSPVRNQGDCGACWAFTTIGLLEGQQMMNKDANDVSSLEPLSAQNLIDCDDINGGCVGGVTFRALYHIATAGGLQTERDYPFVSDKSGVARECQFNKTLAHKSTLSIKGPVFLKSDDEESLKKDVANYGPIAVSMEATWSFYQYRGGIYFESQPRLGRLNHAVLIVGYGTTDTGDDYWIIKNSWGVEWGEEGFGRIARNKGNHCGIEEVPIFFKYK